MNAIIAPDARRNVLLDYLASSPFQFGSNVRVAFGVLRQVAVDSHRWSLNTNGVITERIGERRSVWCDADQECVY